MTTPTTTDPVTAWERRVRDLANPAHVAPFIKPKQQGGSTIVAYIDARAVAAILDRVLGPAGWSFTLQEAPTRPIKQDEAGWYRQKDGKTLFDTPWVAHGRLTIHGPDGRDIIREDVGSSTGDQDNGALGAASGALKRCAAVLGIGRAVYALPKVSGKVNQQGDRAVSAWKQQLAAWGERFVASQGTDEPDPVHDDEHEDKPLDETATAADVSAPPPDGNASSAPSAPQAPPAAPSPPPTAPPTREDAAADAAWDAAGGNRPAGPRHDEPSGTPTPMTRDQAEAILAETRDGDADQRKLALIIRCGGDVDLAQGIVDAVGGNLRYGSTWRRVVAHPRLPAAPTLSGAGVDA